MCIQRRHLKVLRELMDSEIIDHHKLKDLHLIYDTLDKEIRSKDKERRNSHFKEDKYE
jgi:hypothetical protein